jgi:hypothetical protein
MIRSALTHIVWSNGSHAPEPMNLFEKQAAVNPKLIFSKRLIEETFFFWYKSFFCIGSSFMFYFKSTFAEIMFSTNRQQKWKLNLNAINNLIKTIV